MRTIANPLPFALAAIVGLFFFVGHASAAVVVNPSMGDLSTPLLTNASSTVPGVTVNIFVQSPGAGCGVSYGCAVYSGPDLVNQSLSSVGVVNGMTDIGGQGQTLDFSGGATFSLLYGTCSLNNPADCENTGGVYFDNSFTIPAPPTPVPPPGAATELYQTVASTTGNVINSSWPLFFGLLALLITFWAAYGIIHAFVKPFRRM